MGTLRVRRGTPRHSLAHHTISLFMVLVVVVAAGCTTRQPTPTSVPTWKATPTPVKVEPAHVTQVIEEEPMPGFKIALGEGSEQPAAPDRVPTADYVPLSAADTQSLLDRLPPLKEGESDTQDFRLPAESLPAPRPGETVKESFPPDKSIGLQETPEPGDLQVLRYSPQGEVPLAPYLSITFDQPMAALTSIADLKREAVPVTLVPEPEGSWRWVGTKTLMFEPITRFPMATNYRAEIAAGVVSAIGGQLTEALSWSFATPSVSVVKSYPNNSPTVRDPLFFVSFDQRIDQASVLRTISVRASGNTYRLALVHTADIEANDAVRRMAKEAGEGRWVAFRADELLPYDTTVSVHIGPDTPSAEGPLTTDQVQSFSFQTYGPLQIVEANCGYGETCRPMAPWYIRFSNPLDAEAFDPAMVTIEPGVVGANIYVTGDRIRITGATQGRTTYKATVSTEVVDVFGQSLAESETVSFKVGSSEPMLSASRSPFTVLDPVGPRAYSVFTINYAALSVKAYRVQVNDWPDFQEWYRESNRYEDTPTPPGRKVLDKTIRVERDPDRMVQTDIDLTDSLDDGIGHLIVVVQPEQSFWESLKRRGRPPVITTWIQASDIALDAFVDSDTLIAWASALADGTPLAGVSLRVEPDGIPAKTDAAGMAEVTVNTSSSDKSTYLIASAGQDSALLPQSTYGTGRGWRLTSEASQYLWYVFDDRGMYRPGEEVHVKGWVRRSETSKQGDTLRLPKAGETLTYQVVDARGNRLLGDSITLNALGGFDMSFELPLEMNLGTAQLRLTLPQSSVQRDSHQHLFQVQEFRRPEFEVTTQPSQGPHYLGEQGLVSVEASYYAGGPLPNADVYWSVSTSAGTYRPPKWDDFSFGIWRPWWRVLDYGRSGPVGLPYGAASEQQDYEGLTDASGIHRLSIDFIRAEPPQPMSVRAEATVMDVNRQAWAASSTLLVHPAALYVGMRSERTFVEKGQPIPIDAIVTDLDGLAVSDVAIEIRAERLQWTKVKGEWKEIPVDIQVCDLVSTDEPVSCRFDTPLGGTYRIAASIRDDQDRRNISQLTRWVSGGQRPTANRVEQEQVDLIPDRAEYQPGDTAEILVQSPFPDAEGLLTLRRSGIVHSERFTISGSTHTLRVQIGKEHVPNLHVQVDLVGSSPRSDSEGNLLDDVKARPAYATGSLTLSVPPYERTLSVGVAPQETELEPGGETDINVTVRDANGQPVQGAQVAVVVVDEAVLALTGYSLLDPLAVFYPQRSPGVASYYVRRYVLLVDPTTLLEEGIFGSEEKSVQMARSPMAAMPADAEMRSVEIEKVEKEVMMDAPAGMGDDGAQQAIRLRTNMNALALFAPEVTTDSDGTASVAITLPDNLTRYRVMAVAVAGATDYGKTEASITARLPLMVRPSPPRFLNFGDKLELPVILQNQTDKMMSVDVAARTTNLDLTGPSGIRVEVPARDRVEVRFPAAAMSPGTARAQIAVAAGTFADAAVIELPVYTPATTEAFAVYGVVDQGAIAQPVIAPSDVYTQFGGLEITTSSTALQALTDAVLYLSTYRYECSEQLASRILAVAALRDVLSAFEAEGLPDESELVAAVERDLRRLEALQAANGGFPVWRRGGKLWPFHSIHVAHAFARARDKGFEVSVDAVSRSLSYLREIESHYPNWYSTATQRVLTSYALYVRSLLGDVDTASALALIREAGVENLNFESLGWLLTVIADDPSAAAELAAIERHLNNRVTETAGTAHFATSYREEDGYLLLASNRRADGILLEALIETQPDSDLIPKIVKGLLAHRKQGRWGNTQENVFILLALDRYFNTYETQTPEFVARIWLGDQYVAGLDFSGRSTDYQAVDVPMTYLGDAGKEQNLILSKEGPGRLYYRLGIQYAPTSLSLPPLEQGFAVQREYEAVDDPADVTKDDRGVWHIKAGARVRVRLRLVAPTRRYHVALEDPLPAGLEPVNPALAVSGSIPQDPAGGSTSRYWWWRWTWYEHQNLRDQRAEAFASLLWEGIHTYTYLARATTPGEFIVPPAKAEEMYSPDVFGRSGTDRVIVEAD